MLRRMLAASVTILVSVAVLTGCGPDDSPSGRLEQSKPVVSICAKIEASTVEFFVGKKDSDPYNHAPVWKLVGSHTFNVGDTIRFGVIPSGMEEVSWEDQFNPEQDGLAVVIVAVDESAATQVSWWGAGALSETKWSRGTSEDPCA